MKKNAYIKATMKKH